MSDQRPAGDRAADAAPSPDPAEHDAPFNPEARENPPTTDVPPIEESPGEDEAGDGGPAEQPGDDPEDDAAQPAAAVPPPRLSIIIPTLNAATVLPRVLESIAAAEPGAEVIVVDGGSRDGTRRIAEAYGVRFLEGPRGRGTQLDGGARAATGNWLLFLHADSSLQLGWHLIVRGFATDPDNRFRAGYFSLILDDTARAARRVEDLANWRARTLGLPYGDQGLLISHAFYDHLGGFAPLPLMEDVDLARRIGRHRLVDLPSAIVTSARRYRKGGYWLRPARNLLCLALYFLGVPPRLIEGLYR